jgi:hypothetical protein
MKTRGAVLLLTSSLLFGFVAPAFADDTTAHADRVAALQGQYNPIFDAQNARFVALQKKLVNDQETLKAVKEILKDFLGMRATIDARLADPTSDLDAVQSFAEEEAGEFGSSLSLVETQVAKSKTITCVKGKVTKKIMGLTPKCPAGYKKK